MIGVDFTFVNKKEIDRGIFTGSLEIFTADILDSIKQIGYSEHFVIITSCCVRKFFIERFPDYKVVCLGGWIGQIVHFVFRRPGVSTMKKLGFFDRLIKKERIDHVWFPVLTPEKVNGIICEHIGTCHDLLCRLKSNEDMVKEMFMNSSMIVTVSNYVKTQIINLYSIPNDKVVVIPNALRIIDSSQHMEPVYELIGKQYILDCNAFIERKNTLVLLKAFERIKDRTPVDLVLCGGYMNEEYYNDCLTYVKEHRMSERVHFFTFIGEAQKKWLFHNCKLFVTPSKNEGFGRTPIEAALCLKPVISTRVTSLEESTCGLVHYYENPDDDIELSEMIISILEKPDGTDHIIKIRDVFAAKYSSKRIAMEYISTFKKLNWIND